ncbi:hypothetical protein [Devosia sp. A449]
MDAINFAKENWAVIEQAPWAFVVCAALFLGIGFAVSSRLTSERLALAEDRVTDYKEKLEGKSPEEAAQLIGALEKRLSAIEPLTLSGRQMDELAVALSKAPATVDVVHDGISAGSKKLHGQLMAVFQKSGWAVDQGMIVGMGMQPKSAIAIFARNGTPGLQTMISTFHEVGLQFEYQDEERIISGRPNAIYLLVTSPTS